MKLSFLPLKPSGIVAAVGVDHALGERSGVDEFGQRCGEVAVLLIEVVLGAENDAHVGERRGLGVRTSGVSGEFWLCRQVRESVGGALEPAPTA